jgi:multiple sugar transport system permease protein
MHRSKFADTRTNWRLSPGSTSPQETLGGGGCHRPLRLQLTTPLARLSQRSPSARFNTSMARRRSTALGYALLAPSLFGVATFLLLPMLVVVWLSLHRWDLLGPISYVGLDNWRAVLTDATFGNSLVVTVAFIAIVVPVQTALGLAAAAMLAQELPGSGIFRTIYVLPWICAPLAIAVLWRWILAPTDGAVSTVLGTRIEWLTDPGLALPVVAAVTVWSNVGYVTLFFLAGILAIPAEVHAAASTDGATSWQRFWHITLPMLRPTMFFVLVTGIVSAAQVFDTVYALTDGGPEGRTDLVAHRIYAEAFGAAAIGRAAVMAIVLFVILVGVTLVQHLYFRKRITYDVT